MTNRNIEVLGRIIKYCDEINETMDHFGRTFGNLEPNVIYKNAVSMCILQIGELTALLSDDFKVQYAEMPWYDIKAMRNIAAHRYGTFDLTKLWETLTDDIPALYKYCSKVLIELQQQEQTN